MRHSDPETSLVGVNPVDVSVYVPNTHAQERL